MEYPTVAPVRAGTGRTLRKRAVHLGAAVTLLFAIVALPVHAQRRIDVPSRPTCGRCSIEVSKLATLGHLDDPGSADVLIGRVRRDRDGFYYVAPTESPAEILVYDSMGRFQRTIGRAGSGPGEYRRIWHADIDKYDSLYVFDMALRRLSVLAPGSRALSRVSPFPIGFTQVIRLESGDFIINAEIRSRDRAGLPLHRVSPTGEILRSFGDSSLTIVPTTSTDVDAARMLKKLAPAGGDRFWVTNEVGRYELELWNAHGQRLLTLVRNPTWADGGFVITGLMLDSAGRLWVSISIPDPSFKAPALPQAAPGREAPAPPRSERMRTLDSVIEVIDVARGQLIATVRRSDAYVGFDGHDLLTSFRANADGLELIDVWRVRLREPQGREPR